MIYCGCRNIGKYVLFALRAARHSVLYYLYYSQEEGYMGKEKVPFRFHIGQRNIKTAASATLCAALYYPLHRNPTFACIGAVFGMGSDMETSRLNGGNRFFGTLIGGVLGMLLFSIYICFYPEGGDSPLLLLLLFIGIVILIVASQYFRWVGAIQPGCVILCVLFFNMPPDGYIPYAVNRIIDTGIGVVISLFINAAFSRERVNRWLASLRDSSLSPPRNDALRRRGE